MSSIIRITKDIIEEAKAELETNLLNSRASSGKLSFTKDISVKDQKATLYFTEQAYLKMKALVDNFESEVAWHGIAKRYGNEKDNEYLIEDIVVYPQEITGVTVTTDQVDYQNWLYSFDDDVFNNIRMQGHSHVRMSTTPSAVDRELYDGILNQLGEDMFYIFIIWNKRDEKTIEIYEMKKNILYTTSDITVKLFQDEDGLCSFIDNAKEVAKKKVESTAVTTFSGAAKHKTKGKTGYGADSNSTKGYYGGYVGDYARYDGYGYDDYYNDYDDFSRQFNEAQVSGKGRYKRSK